MQMDEETAATVRQEYGDGQTPDEETIATLKQEHGDLPVHIALYASKYLGVDAWGCEPFLEFLGRLLAEELGVQYNRGISTALGVLAAKARKGIEESATERAVLQMAVNELMGAYRQEPFLPIVYPRELYEPDDVELDEE